MTDTTPPATPRWLAWMPAFAAAATAAGALLASGGYISDLADHGRRIDALERRYEQIHEIDKRTTRIEAKVDMLVPHDPEVRK